MTMDCSLKFAYAENELHFFLYYFFIDLSVCGGGGEWRKKKKKPLGKSTKISWEGALYSNRILSLYSYVDHKMSYIFNLNRNM